MHWARLATAIGLFCVAAAAGLAQPASPETSSEVSLTGQPVLPANLFTSASIYGASSSSLTPVAVAGVPFDQAFKLATTANTPYAYSAGLGWTIARNIPENDLLMLTFWVKNDNPGLEVLRVVPTFQDDATYNFSLSANAPSDQATWVKYAIPFRANQLYTVSGDGASLWFFFGNMPQSFEIGGIQLLDYGQVANPIPASLLGAAAFYYPGRGDPSAAWRVAALKNIAATRMANLQVTVTGKGNPVKGATVTVNETRSAFHWGSAIDGCNVAGLCLGTADTALYKANIVKNFNTVVPENDLKWPNWECCHPYAIDMLDFADENRLQVRGHNLIWPSFQWMPADTAKLSASQLATRIDNHFENEMEPLRGGIYEWDVVNEPYSNSQVQGLIPGVANVTPSEGVLGNASIAGWYALAAKLDPTPVLNLNDYSVFESKDPVHETYDLALIRYIDAHGGRVGGFSFESHFSQSAPVFADMQATIDDYGPWVEKFGVTEFDFATLDPALQSDLTGDYLTFIFGQPKFNEFLMWGFWDGASWIGNAPLYNLDWSLKPSGQIFETLTQQTWQTHAKGSTGAGGQYAVRAYLGVYEVTAAFAGKVCATPVNLAGNAAVTIAMDCD